MVVKRNVGVSKVLASGRRASRLEAAKGCGADLVIDAARQDAVAAIMEATAGMGVNCVVKCAGSPDTFRQSIEMVQGSGSVLLVAIYEEPLTWDPGMSSPKTSGSSDAWEETSPAPSS